MAFENYKYEEKEEYKPLPVGDYRIKIEECEIVKSSNGRDMIKFVFVVSKTGHKIFHYIVNGEYFNQNISRFFDAFPQIEKGNFNVASYIGKVGACHTKHEEYNGNVNSKVHYFIHASKQANLPAWIEPEKKDQNNSSTANSEEFAPVPDVQELPFE